MDLYFDMLDVAHAKIQKNRRKMYEILVSIVVSTPACHAGDRGSIPRRGEILFFFSFQVNHAI